MMATSYCVFNTEQGAQDAIAAIEATIGYPIIEEGVTKVLGYAVAQKAYNLDKWFFKQPNKDINGVAVEGILASFSPDSTLEALPDSWHAPITE